MKSIQELIKELQEIETRNPRRSREISEEEDEWKWGNNIEFYTKMSLFFSSLVNKKSTNLINKLTKQLEEVKKQLKDYQKEKNKIERWLKRK